MARLEFDLEKAVGAVKKKKAGLVLLQVPEGLKRRAKKIALEIEKKTNAKTITLANPCYGACDIPLCELRRFNADLAIQFGHSKMVEAKNIEYIPLHYGVAEKTLEALSERAASKIKKNEWKKAGLVASVQFLPHLGLVKKVLEKRGVKTVVGKAAGMERGQVLGCNTVAAESVSERVECFVYVGDGRFHPLGVAAKTGKKVFMLDPLRKTVKEIMEKEIQRLERAHLARIEIAKQAKTFGLLVSTKPGQEKLEKALLLKELAEKNGKKAIIIASGELREEFVLGMEIDCFVNTACPRIVLDDAKNWKNFLISSGELKKALGL